MHANKNCEAIYLVQYPELQGLTIKRECAIFERATELTRSPRPILNSIAIWHSKQYPFIGLVLQHRIQIQMLTWKS